MKSLIQFLAPFLLVPLAAAEEPAHPAKPLLWKIEGGSLEKPSYLFGTIHLSGGPLKKLHPAAEAAFQQSSSVLTEIPLDKQTQMAVAAKVIRMDGKTLSESIGEELSGKLDEALKAINPDLDSTPFQAFRTWAVAATLPQLEVQLAGIGSIDEMIWKRATDEGKATGALETADFQVGIFDSFTEDEQKIFLSETLRMMEEDRKTGKNRITEMIETYAEGDPDKIKQLLEKAFDEMLKGPHKELGKKLADMLLVKRDESMAAKIIEKLKASPDTVHFIAAGAGHFVGDTSIRSHLEKAGYRITRIVE